MMAKHDEHDNVHGLPKFMHKDREHEQREGARLEKLEKTTARPATKYDGKGGNPQTGR
jgi:hypothetical protein